MVNLEIITLSSNDFIAFQTYLASPKSPTIHNVSEN